MTKQAEKIKQPAPRAHFLATKIYKAVRDLLAEQTVLYDGEINTVADACEHVSKVLLNSYYRDRK